MGFHKHSSTARFLAKAALSVSALGLAAASTFAGEAQTFKISHLFNSTVYLWEHGGQTFVDEVDRAAAGRAKFEVYPSGQLGKDLISTLKSGLADISIIPVSYAGDKLPLSSVAELPGTYGSGCEGTRKLWNVAKQGGPLNEAEYATQGMHVLFVTSLPPYHITTARPVTGELSSISGKKIRANGAAMDKTVRALGAVPVKISAAELYDSISRGTIDGGLYNYLGIPEYHLEDVLKHSVEGPRLGGVAIVFAMRAQSWQGLSDEMKNVFTEAAAKAQTALCEWTDSNDAAIRDRIAANNGHTVVKMTPEQIAEWEKATEVVVSGWKQEMDAAGKNGSAMFDAFNTSN